MTKKTGVKDVYQIVADQIINALEAGKIPWRKPWAASGMVPQNLISKRPYNGVNVLLTGMQGYACPYWATFKQVKERGGHVTKGEKGTTVVFWRILKKTVTDEDTGEEKEKKVFFLRYYTVFNIDQTDLEWTKPEPKNAGEPIPACEAIVNGYKDGPSIRHGQGQAFYSPSGDYIGMPDLTMFDTERHYYATLFHEMVHSTGHKKRLNRFKDQVAAYGKEEYSREELVAEIGSAFLACETGIDEDDVFNNSIGYLQGWRERIKNDPRCVVIAAGQAQKAVDMIKGEEQNNGEDHD